MKPQKARFALRGSLTADGSLGCSRHATQFSPSGGVSNCHHQLKYRKIRISVAFGVSFSCTFWPLLVFLQPVVVERVLRPLRSQHLSRVHSWILCCFSALPGAAELLLFTLLFSRWLSLFLCHCEQTGYQAGFCACVSVQDVGS